MGFFRLSVRNSGNCHDQKTFHRPKRSAKQCLLKMKGPINRLINVFFWERKTGFGIVIIRVRDARFSGMLDQEPPSNPSLNCSHHQTPNFIKLKYEGTGNVVTYQLTARGTSAV